MADATKIVVIGGGPGGYVTAIRAAQLCAQVTLIEKDTLGGTCLNRGCIPTKALLQAASFLTSAKKAEAFGVRVENVSLNFLSTMKWKDAIIRRLVGSVSSLMRKNKIRVIKGTSTLVGPRTIGVLESNEEIKCDKIIIATGSKPLMVSIKGINQSGVMTSNDALLLDKLPQSVLIIGGGVIGLESLLRYWVRWVLRSLWSK